MQLDQAHLAGLLAKQAFRIDAKSYAGPIRHLSASRYGEFASSCQIGIVGRLKANLDANKHTTVNERAAVNSMLVLNKIRTVSLSDDPRSCRTNNQILMNRVTPYCCQLSITSSMLHTQSV